VTAYVALLRAINAGTKLPMTDLKRLCEEAGFDKVRTYIASGNVLFESSLPAEKVKSLLEAALEGHAGKRIPAMIRTAAEMAAVSKANPFPEDPKNTTVAIFLDDAPAGETLETLKHQDGEKVALGTREIYVAYGPTIARSKLAIPAAKDGTARNVNTIAKLAEMAAAI
jgi:uncharacterized protein (DUF1697 family)